MCQEQVLPVFYGAFDDQFNAMDAILNGKESFALQVMLCSRQICFFLELNVCHIF